MDTRLGGRSIFTVTPEGFSLTEVVVRLARPEEHRKWDALVDAQHYLGFKRFAGRGLRYIAEWRGLWIALAGWQSGAFKSRHRDRWIGWTGDLRYRAFAFDREQHPVCGARLQGGISVSRVICDSRDAASSRRRLAGHGTGTRC